MLVTDPPITIEIVGAFNRGFHPSLHVAVHKGLLVVNQNMLNMLKNPPDSREAAREYLEVRLTAIEDAFRKQKDDKEEARLKKLEEVASFFSVPLN